MLSTCVNLVDTYSMLNSAVYCTMNSSLLQVLHNNFSQITAVLATVMFKLSAFCVYLLYR